MENDRHLAIRVILLPKDTNAHGTIFGGVIMSHLDLAGAVEARRVTRQQFVTVAMKQIEFLEPVFVGDIVSFYTQTEHVGNTSITVRVEVEAARKSAPDTIVKVTGAEVVFVAVDEGGRKIPVRLIEGSIA